MVPHRPHRDASAGGVATRVAFVPLRSARKVVPERGGGGLHERLGTRASSWSKTHTRRRRDLRGSLAAWALHATMDRALTYNFGFLPPNKSRRAAPRWPPPLRAARDQAHAARVHPARRPHSQREPADITSLEWRCVNYVRVLAADMVQQANSGHPGAAMGCAPMAHLLWSK